MIITPDELAAEFAKLLQQGLEPWEWDEMQRRNAQPGYADDICASHDFCDSNMVMLAAFEALHKRPMVMDDTAAGEIDRALWNAAWSVAKTKYLTLKGTT